MAADTRSSTERLVRELVGFGELRVWSVIITIFGDVSQRPQDRIGGQSLSELANRIGIKPDAMRVAIHRLKKDGWLNASRHGRNSRYGLTARGFAMCQQARPRIYAKAASKARDIRVLIAAVSSGTPAAVPEGFAQIAPRVYLGRGKADDPEKGFFVLIPRAESVPDWLCAALGPADLVAAYAALAGILKRVSDTLSGRKDLAPLDAQVLRILTIHRWRQLLLRHPDLPAHYFPAGWQGETCRQYVQKIIAAVPPAPPAPG